jgi:hypothetical protein
LKLLLTAAVALSLSAAVMLARLMAAHVCICRVYSGSLLSAATAASKRLSATFTSWLGSMALGFM